MTLSKMMSVAIALTLAVSLSTAASAAQFREFGPTLRLQPDHQN